MAANMYRVGDYVYFENSSSNPYLIRRIEELNKTANGNVEAKVVCFYRRRDISSTLIALADKHATLSVCYKTGPGADNGEEGEIEEEMENPEMVDLPEKLKHQLRHRELFLSRQLESLPATHIRGKCSVTLLNETESLKSYLEREDFFFYSLVYDPQQKTLLADKGEIRVGNRYQADITDLLKEGEEDGRDQSRLETKVWEAHNPLIDKQIDQFLVVARSVGTFARALDCSSSVRQPSLHMSAAAASRDITLFHAMDTLHKSVYDVAKAISALVPQGGPVLCRDEMEEWSASEASLFEEALEKYGKDFTDIQQDFLPWKSLTSIIEYYYMWKTTDRYVQQKRLKAAEAESKLKQVYIPNYNKPNPNQISVNNVKAGVVNGAGAPGQSPGAGRACESCYTAQSYQWYSWGPPNMQCRLCASCWTYWKKYGGLKMPTRLDGERPGPNRSNMSPHGIPARSSGSPKFAMKTRQAFYLHTTKLTRIARRLCREILRPWHAARHPYMPINSAAIKAECTARLPEASQSPLVLKQAVRKPLEAVLRYLETHPRPPKPDPVKSVSGVLGGLTPAKSAPVINNGSPTILGKRSYEQHNGVDGNMKKRLLMPSRGKACGGRWQGCCASPRALPVCAVPLRAWCTAGGSGLAQGPVHAGRAAPCFPALPRFPCRWAESQVRPHGSPIARTRTPSPSPGPLARGVSPPSRPSAWSVDCPCSCSPGAPAACLYCLPSRCDRPHAVSLCSRGCPRCAYDPPVRPAVGGGALGPRPLWWGQIGPSCGPGRQGWGRHARPKGMSRPGPDGEARGARCPRAEAARSEWGRTPRGRGEAGGGEQGPWDPAATQCPGGWRFGSGPPDRPGQCTVTAPVAQGLALPPQLGEGHPRALRPRHSEVLRGVAVVAARGLWAPEALAPQRPPAAGSVWKGGRDRGSRSEALLTEARGHGAGQRAQTCPEFLLTQGWGAAAKEWARHGDLRGAAGSGHLASPCPGPCPLACPRPPVPGCLSS
uniref:Metastasis associated 1 n=1 Tax=Canis lupus familiaris TaxID=9615 RepID=A0A8P0PH35_CANLF